MTILSFMVTGILAFFGYLRIKRKRSKVRNYLREINYIYNSYYHDTKVCQYRLTAIRDNINYEFDQGKIEEGQYNILDRKIHEYIKGIKDKEGSETQVK